MLKKEKKLDYSEVASVAYVFSDVREVFLKHNF